jgi:hypothetical protein
LEQTIALMENYLECWKQFPNFIGMARSKNFTQDDENQFLEIKSVITQQLELILAAFETPVVNRDDIHGLLHNASSISAMSVLSEAALRNLENQWHKIFISLQAVLGQLKVQQQKLAGESFFSGLFRKK